MNLTSIRVHISKYGPKNKIEDIQDEMEQMKRNTMDLIAEK